jgi:hypothetical protein
MIDANVLYPSATPAAAPAPQAAAAPAPVAASPAPAASPETADTRVDELYAGPAEAAPLAVPENIRALRKASESTADMLYGATAVDPVIAGIFEGAELTVPERKAASVEMTRMARDVGLDQDDLAEMASRAPDVRQLTPEQVGRNQAEAARMLREAFGDQAAQALADAQKLALRDPRTAALLDKTGLGNDPQTILKFARLAVRERSRGRL